MTRAASAGALLVTLALAGLVLITGCSSVGKGHPTFESRFDRYLSLPNSKAMAAAGDMHGHFVYGIGYGWLSTGLAIDKAFEQCNVRRSDLTAPSKCRLIAVNSQIVEGNAKLEALYGKR